ncbi:MAG TPA: ankyrin repeat domain-containing protein [Vicinamibacterales bacterium]
MPGAARLRFVAAALLFAGLAAPAAAAPRDHRLADAAEQRNWTTFDRLLKSGGDVRAPQPDGATALHWATYWDRPAAVDALIGAGVDVNAANDNGVVPLALASENKNDALVERLLAAGANPNAATVTGETVLMTAARGGSVAAVKALLSHGANPNTAEPVHQQTALMWAISERHPAVVQLLLQHGADVHARTRVRHRTVQLNTRYSDQKSVRGVTETDLGGFTPLLFAARVGDVESAQHLLAAGADANETTPNRLSALVVAAHSGSGPLAMLLIDRGADVNADGGGYTALHAAILRGDAALVKALVAHGADVRAPLRNGTPSRYYSKDFAFNEDLVGATPIWLAARFGEPDMIRTLAAAGADVNGAMADGTTPLMTAILPTRGLGTFRAGDRRERYQGPNDVAIKADGEDEIVTIEVAQCLLDLGGRINETNQAGDTALHVAAGLAANRVVQFLVEHGADLHAKNKSGQTPLGLATAAPSRDARLQYFFVGADERKSTAELLRKLGATE